MQILRCLSCVKELRMKWMFFINETYPHLHYYASSCTMHLHASSILKYHASSCIKCLEVSFFFMHHASSCSRSIFKNVLFNVNIPIYSTFVFLMSAYIANFSLLHQVLLLWSSGNEIIKLPHLHNRKFETVVWNRVIKISFI